MGQISKELEKVQTTGSSSVRNPIDGKPKAQQLREAGISTSTANRYEELVGPSTEIGLAITEEYFINAEANNGPVSMKEFRTAIKKTVKETFLVQAERALSK
jgi:hypothetical protein